MEGKGKGCDEATTNANIFETHNPDAEDVFMDQELKGGKDIIVQDEKMAADETIDANITRLGKRLSRALQDSKLIGLVDDEKEIHIKWVDEDGRILSPTSTFATMMEFPGRLTPMLGDRKLTRFEASRLILRNFYAEVMKQTKRIRQYHEELKVKQMNNSDTPSSSSVERIREAQSKSLKTPDLVLSGHGQASDPISGFATMEDVPTPMLGDRKLTAKEAFRRLSHKILGKTSSAASDTPSSLSVERLIEDFSTPMLGDRKVEHLLGIKRKSEPGDMGSLNALGC